MKKTLLIMSATVAALWGWALTGDVNGDGLVTIADANAVISYILNGNADGTVSAEDADVNGDGLVTIADANLVVSIILNGSQENEVTPIEIAVDSTDLAESPDVVPDTTDEYYGDYVETETFNNMMKVTFRGDTAIVDNVDDEDAISFTVQGAHVTLTSTKKMEVLVYGSTSNGSLKIYSVKKVRLQLNNVSITNPNGAAINNQCGKSFYVVVPAGSVSTLCDGPVYTMVDNEDQKGTLFSEGQTIFSGGGQLNVYSTGKSGIVSDDYLRFRPGTKIYVNSTAGNGIRGKDAIFVDGSVINVEVSAPGSRGMSTDSLLSVRGGRTTVLATGVTRIDSTTVTDSLGNVTTVLDTTTCAAAKAKYDMTMTGGTLRLLSSADDSKALSVDGNITHTGGTLQAVALGQKVTSPPRAIRVDGNVSVSGGNFYGCSVNSDALSSVGTLTVADGYATFVNTTHLFQVDY